MEVGVGLMRDHAGPDGIQCQMFISKNRVPRF